MNEPDFFDDTLKYLELRYPEQTGTVPEWPRFDRMKKATEGLNVQTIALMNSISRDDLPSVVGDIAACTSLLMSLSATLGVDIRPVWKATHQARMLGDKTVDIQALLDLQDPIR